MSDYFTNVNVLMNRSYGIVYKLGYANGLFENRFFHITLVGYLKLYSVLKTTIFLMENAKYVLMLIGLCTVVHL